MASCKDCVFYSKVIDDLGRSFNDVGSEGAHFCPMYHDTIPNGVFEGEKLCKFFEDKEVKS